MSDITGSKVQLVELLLQTQIRWELKTLIHANHLKATRYIYHASLARAESGSLPFQLKNFNSVIWNGRDNTRETWNKRRENGIGCIPLAKRYFEITGLSVSRNEPGFKTTQRTDFSKGLLIFRPITDRKLSAKL